MRTNKLDELKKSELSGALIAYRKCQDGSLKKIVKKTDAKTGKQQFFDAAKGSEDKVRKEIQKMYPSLSADKIVFKESAKVKAARLTEAFDWSVGQDDRVIDLILNCLEWYYEDDSFVERFEAKCQKLVTQKKAKKNGERLTDQEHEEISRQAIKSIMPEEEEFKKAAEGWLASGACKDAQDSELFDKFLGKEEVAEEPEQSDPFDRYDLGPWTEAVRRNCKALTEAHFGVEQYFDCVNSPYAINDVAQFCDMCNKNGHVAMLTINCSDGSAYHTQFSDGADFRKFQFAKNETSAITKVWAKECDPRDTLGESVKLTEAAKYKAPDSPYKKFESDLARELTAKHFPIWSYSKVDKKVYRSPLTILHDGHYGYNDYICFASGFGSDQLAIEPGHGYGIVCYIESEGKGEEYFQNTNSAIPSEGYKTDDNFYYQGPTWRVRGGEDGKAKDFLKEGLARNQIADAVIECLKASCPKRDFDAEWDQMIVDIGDKIKGSEEYVKEYSAKLAADPDEVDSGDGAWKDSWFRGKIEKNVRGAEKRIKELTDALQEPALSPEYLAGGSDAAADRKSRNWYGGTWTASYDGKTGHWITAAWNKATAIRQVKHSFPCSRRASTGCSREPDYLAASVKCTNEFTSAEEAKAWSDSHYAYSI